MAMRCSEWNRDLWRRIWAAADQYRDHPWAEQKALHSLLDAEPQVHRPLPRETCTSPTTMN